MPDDADLVPVRRALISVSDKAGVVDFAGALQREFGVEIVSTGGTASALREGGVEVVEVSDLTGVPEMMGGRVKTLHPKVHGGILARLPEDRADLEEHGIGPIDLVCVNLYPFERTVARPDASYNESVEDIDIGGPCLIRAAAKNHARVLVVTDPDDYRAVLIGLRESDGRTTAKARTGAARRAFLRTSLYDQQINEWLAYYDGELDDRLWEWPGMQSLRYGENPHQPAEMWRKAKRPAEASVAFAKQHHGKELSYINLLDADAALSVVKDFDGTACCIVKHATPCGVGVAADALASAFEHAYDGDPLAAFGGVLAVNHPVDEETAGAMVDGQKFLEVIVAPSFSETALALLKDRWKNVRLLEVGPMLQGSGRRAPRTMHYIVGGTLTQDRDLIGVVESEWKVVSDRQPADAERAALRFNWLVCKHVKSNAVVIGGETGTYGIGGGQVDRVAAAEQAVRKAGGGRGGPWRRVMRSSRSQTGRGRCWTRG